MLQLSAIVGVIGERASNRRTINLQLSFLNFLHFPGGSDWPDLKSKSWDERQRVGLLEY